MGKENPPGAKIEISGFGEKFIKVDATNFCALDLFIAARACFDSAIASICKEEGKSPEQVYCELPREFLLAAVSIERCVRFGAESEREEDPSTLQQKEE